jgi:hypothetical protein
MTRTLPTVVGAGVAASDGFETADLVELQFGSGTLRWTTASVDLAWAGETWTAVGGALVVGEPQESSDDNAAGVSLSFSATDGAVMAALLGQTFLGRKARIYRASLRQSDGALDAVEIFNGFLNDAITIRDERDPVTGAGSVEVETRLTARTGDLARQRGFRTNIASHQAVYADDLFFQFVPDLAGRSIRWGRPIELVGAPTPGSASPIGGRGGKQLE